MLPCHLKLQKKCFRVVNEASRCKKGKYIISLFTHVSKSAKEGKWAWPSDRNEAFIIYSTDRSILELYLEPYVLERVNVSFHCSCMYPNLPKRANGRGQLTKMLPLSFAVQIGVFGGCH